MKGHKITLIVSIVGFLFIVVLIAYEALQVNDGEPSKTDVEINDQSNPEDEATVGDIGQLVIMEKSLKR